MRLVIAEKGELARDIAAALLDRQPDQITLPAEGNGWCVCAASGHLLELAEPAQVDPALREWSEDALPISFDPWPKVPRDAKAERRLEDIARLARGAEEIYCCGDADDEGQLIVDEILEYAGIDPASSACKRVYVNDNLPKNIIRAFDAPLANAGCMGAGRAAHARQLADMCFGVNESRLATCRLGTMVSVGRVQTPTLGLVVARDMAIETHVARSYYELHAVLDDGGHVLECVYEEPAGGKEGRRFATREAAEEAARALDGACVRMEIERAEKRLEAPLPFELATLTSDLSARCSMTADEVMRATQALRDERKAITYNRTDSPYLKSEHYDQAPGVVATALANLGAAWECDTGLRSRAFDDSKVRAHHAIIPQEKKVDVGSLPEGQRAAYEAIAVRYLVQFMPPAAYVETHGRAKAAGLDGALVYKAAHLEAPGWAEVAPASWSKVRFADGSAPDGGLREMRVLSYEVREGKTAPAKRYTDGTLIAAMSQIARYVEDPEVRRVLLEKDAGSPDEHGSIGTAATRPSIIEGLVRRGYIERAGTKGRPLKATAKGRALWRVLPDEVKGVDTTARWWLMQQQVSHEDLGESEIMRDVVRLFEERRAGAYRGVSLDVAVGRCPECGNPVVKRGKVYTCATNRSEKGPDGKWQDVAGCGFKLYPWCGKALTERQAQALLSGKTVPLRGCVSKAGKKFDCRVRLAGKGRLEIVKDKQAFGKGGGGYARR